MELVNYKSSESPWSTFPTWCDFVGDINGDGYEDMVVSDLKNVYVYFNPLGRIPREGPFVRGDANQDGARDVADPIAVLSYLFSGAGVLPCLDAADANDDETVNIADAVSLLMWLFGGGGPPPEPAVCGPDPDGDLLGCRDPICR